MSEKQHIVFKDSPLAHKYCVGEGVELGAAAHNPFNLSDCINIAPSDDFEQYKRAQEELCGTHAPVDYFAEANDLPLANGSKDYIISSHVVEHIPNLIGAFLEWNRVLRPGGIIFMIVPKHGAHKPDQNRPLSSVSEMIRAYTESWTPETAPGELTKAAGGPRGHYWVFSVENMLELVRISVALLGLYWEVVEVHETDDKVGNGHLFVFRFNPPAVEEVLQVEVEDSGEVAQVAEEAPDEKPKRPTKRKS